MPNMSKGPQKKTGKRKAPRNEKVLNAPKRGKSADEDKERHEEECLKAPQAPKEPRTCWLIFIHEVKAAVVKEFPEKNENEIGKEIGRRWNLLEQAERV